MAMREAREDERRRWDGLSEEEREEETRALLKQHKKLIKAAVREQREQEEYERKKAEQSDLTWGLLVAGIVVFVLPLFLIMQIINN
jgi:uncharacterized integral membrane protein